MFPKHVIPSINTFAISILRSDARLHSSAVQNERFAFCGAIFIVFNETMFLAALLKHKN